MKEGTLIRNDIGRWEFAGIELTSGDVAEILLAGQWLRGRVEYMHGSEAYSFIVSSGLDSETVVLLHTGMQARLPEPGARRDGEAPFKVWPPEAGRRR